MGNGQELRCRHISLVFRTHLKISLGHDIKTKLIGVQSLSYIPPSLNHSFFFGVLDVQSNLHLCSCIEKDRQKPHIGACHKLDAQKGMTRMVAFLVYPRLSAFSNLKYWRASMSPWSYSSLNSVQLLRCVQLFATPWTAARQASPSITNSWSLPKLMSIKLVMPSNHLILCRPLLLLPSIVPSIRVFSNESVLCIRWPKYWSFSFSICPS